MASPDPNLAWYLLASADPLAGDSRMRLYRSDDPLAAMLSGLPRAAAERDTAGRRT